MISFFCIQILTIVLFCLFNNNLKLLLLQAKRRALMTDEWLRVKGCEAVYAIGDCATITQRKIMVSYDF